MAVTRKSLTTELADVLAEMRTLSKDEKPAPARVQLLVSRLDALKFLMQSEQDALDDEVEKLRRENSELRRHVASAPPPKSPEETEIDARVAEMVRRHQESSIHEPKSSPPPLSRSESTSHIAVGGNYVTKVDDEEFVT